MIRAPRQLLRPMNAISRSCLLRAAVFLGSACHVHAAFDKVFDCEDLALGSASGQSGFTSGDVWSAVVADPADGAKKSLQHVGNTGDFRFLLPAGQQVADGTTATLFYRFRLSATNSDAWFGLSNSTSSESSGAYGPVVRYDDSTTKLGGITTTGGNNFGGDTSLVANVWYKVWFHLNSTTDTYTVFLQSDGDPAYSARTQVGGTYQFRVQGTQSMLALLFISDTANINVFYDDCYIDVTTNANSTDPLSTTDPDADDDGMLDVWEQQIIDADPGDGITDISHVLPGGDYDGDLATNLQEFTANTDPTVVDTDNDDINDGPEINTYGTNPLIADTDGDGLNDGAEVSPAHATNPLAADTDLDGYNDYIEEIVYETDGNDSGSVPDVFALIGNARSNGSFELVNGVQAIANVTSGFDTVGSDVDHWKQWISTAGGTVASASAIHGAYVGTFPSGGVRGGYNMTGRVVQENDIISLEWYCPTNSTSVTGFIVYDDDDDELTPPVQGLAVASLNAAAASTTNRNILVYKVPAGSPMIGKKLGAAFDGSGGANIDAVHLTVNQVDSDNDGLSDYFEDQYWGDNDGNPSPAELAVTTGAADSDGDGFSNATEVDAGSNPTNPSSRPGDEDGDSLQDEWELTYFGSLTAQDGSGDPDADYATNEQEETAGTNPTDTSSWPDTDGDTLNDGWEIVHFGNITAQNATGNPDGDNADNAAEYAAGSAPNDGTWTPSQAKLVHRWSFNGNLEDSIGGSHATIIDVGANDVSQTAQGVTLAGGDRAASDYVSLGSNLVGGQKNPVTIELWATQNEVQNWSRIFSFGSSATEALMMTWSQGTNPNQDLVQYRDQATSSSTNTNAPYALGTKYHIVMTLTPAIHTAGAISSGTRVTWYRAAFAGTGSTHVTPLWTQRGTFDTANVLANLNDVNLWLGRSEASADATASATYDEVRIWDGALTETERSVAQAAGPDATSLVADTDSDGLPDAWEAAYFGDLTRANVDSDGDGVINADELADQSNPNNAASKSGDVDADGLSDPNFEMLYFGDLDENGSGDPDGDHANNKLEETGDTAHGGSTNPTSAFDWPDTDEDTLNDGLEEHLFGNNDGDIDPGDLDETPEGDFDGDTVSNGDEIFGMQNSNFGFAPTNPAVADSDGDGRTDAQELPPGVTNPNDADTDNDGLSDGEEATAGSNPLLTDTDSDTHSDYREVILGSDPNLAGSTPVIPALHGFISNTKRNGSFELVNGSVATADVENGWDLPGNDVDHWSLRFGTNTEGGVDTNAAASDGTHVGIFTGGVTRGIYNLTGHVAQAGEIYFLQWFHVADDSGNTGYIVYDHDDNPATVPVVVGDAAATMTSAGVNTMTPNVIVWRVPAGSPVIGHRIGAGLEGTGSTRVDSVTFGVAAADSDSDGMVDYEEEFWFGDADETIEAGELAQTGSGDFDGDGSDNATELRLNLDPRSPSARFAATFTVPGSLSWPSVTGVTFKVERSTTLASWETLVESLPGTAGTRSYTDAAPPAGKAFYKITLNP